MAKLLMVILLLEPTDGTPIRVRRQQPAILGYPADGILRSFLSSVFRERLFGFVYRLFSAMPTLQLTQWVGILSGPTPTVNRSTRQALQVTISRTMTNSVPHLILKPTFSSLVIVAVQESVSQDRPGTFFGIASSAMHWTFRFHYP